MRKDKLTILAEIQTEFGDKSMKEVNLAILLLKTLIFLDSKLFAFIVATLCVCLGMFSAYLCGAKWENLTHPIALIINVAFHAFIFTKYNKKSEKDLIKSEEERYSLECILEIKRIKLETK
jgi:energy-coupling factor transporter transmembrane protein EcfT